MTVKQKSLAYLYRELRAARIAYGQAERRTGVRQEELDNLQSRIEVLEWTAAVVTKEDEE
jgi:hypothetical protein